MRKIRLTRDSVSMGDEVGGTSLEIEVNEYWLIEKILDEILRINYLPKMSGDKATWSVAFENPIAVISQQWEKPEIIIHSEFPFPHKEQSKIFNRLHFSYYPDEEAWLVYRILNGFRTIYQNYI
jgi:hypothetical protein